LRAYCANDSLQAKPWGNLQQSGGLPLGTQQKSIEVLMASTDEPSSPNSESTEAKFRRYIDSSPDGVFIINENGRYLEANPAALRMTGYSLEELLTMSISDLAPLDDRSAPLERLETLKVHGSLTHEVQFLHKDGSMRWWALEAIRLTDTRYLGFARDTTERKQTELALAACRRELEVLHRISEIALRERDLPRTLREVTRQVSTALGFPIVAIEYYHAARQEMEFAAVTGFSLPIGETLKVPVAQSLSGIVARNGQPLVETRAAQRPEYSFGPLRSLGIQTFVCVPMIVGTEVIGTMSLGGTESVPVDEEVVPLASSLANFIASIVDRERAEESLRESERTYRAQFARNSAAMLLIDFADGTIVDANDTALSFYGYSREQMLAMRITDINIQPPIKTRHDWESVTVDRSGRFEFQHRLADGSIRDVEVSSSQIQLGQRRVLHSIIFDITVRKQLENSLRETQSILQSAMGESPAGIAIADAPTGKLRYVNDAGLFIRGGDRKTVVEGVGIDRYVASWQMLNLDGTPLEVDEVPLARAILYGEKNSREFLIRRSEGDDRVVLANAAPILDAQGQISAAVVVFLDITDRVQAEDALKHSEARHTKMVENIGDVIVIIGADGINRYKSPNIERWFGWKPEEVVGKNTWDNVHPDDVAAARGFIGSLLERSGATGTTECRYRCKDGSYKWIEFTGANLLGHPDVDGILGNYRDITERKRADENKAKLEAQLLQSQKMESVGRLAGGVAHDFNNMLGVILGHTEMAMEQVDPSSPLHDDLEEVRSAAKRSADLTRQLLAFARKQTVSPQLLNLNQTVGGMLRMLERLIGENIRLDWRPKEDLWLVRVDPSQVDQILANLCINARDAISGVGTIRIETGHLVVNEQNISSHPGVTPGAYVTLSVTDDGSGIDEVTLAKVFEPFFTTKAIGEGTGLGLATVYGSVKQSGGFIHAVSEPGQGATFRTYLPRFVPSKEGVAVTSVRPKSTGGHEVILLVEDEPAVMSVSTRMLTRLGYTVLKASTAGEAIRIARSHAGSIDLLITDVIMPEMNGRDVARRLLSLYPSLKRLFMSGYTADVIAGHGVLDDDVHFLQKPFTMGELTEKVRKVLDE